MAFSTNRNTVTQFSAIIDNMIDIKDVVQTARAELGSGNYPADRLIALVQQLKTKVDALEVIKVNLSLSGGNTGSFVAGFNTVITEVNSFLDFVRVNIPASGGFLLLFTMDTDFNLKPRVFTGGTLTALDSRLNTILQEIN